MFQINGHEISGFTRESFGRALARAAAEGLRAERSATAGAVDVVSDGRVYQATRDTCTCIAGQYHKPCKHRAMVAYLLDGLGLDITQGIAGARVRPQAVAAAVAAIGVEPATLTQRVRQGWTADRSWMREYGVDM